MKTVQINIRKIIAGVMVFDIIAIVMMLFAIIVPVMNSTSTAFAEVPYTISEETLNKISDDGTKREVLVLPEAEEKKGMVFEGWIINDDEFRKHKEGEIVYLDEIEIPDDGIVLTATYISKDVEVAIERVKHILIYMFGFIMFGSIVAEVCLCAVGVLSNNDDLREKLDYYIALTLYIVVIAFTPLALGATCVCVL